MSEFVELKDGWWFRRSDITAFRVVPAFIAPRISKPYVAVWVQGEPGEFHVEFDDLKQAEAAARKIRGVSQSEAAEWEDSRIIDQEKTINRLESDNKHMAREIERLEGEIKDLKEMLREYVELAKRDRQRELLASDFQGVVKGGE